MHELSTINLYVPNKNPMKQSMKRVMLLSVQSCCCFQSQSLNQTRSSKDQDRYTDANQRSHTRSEIHGHPAVTTAASLRVLECDDQSWSGRYKYNQWSMRKPCKNQHRELTPTPRCRVAAGSLRIAGMPYRNADAASDESKW